MRERTPCALLGAPARPLLGRCGPCPRHARRATGQMVEGPKPRDDSAGTAEPEDDAAVGGIRRIEVRTHREDSGERAIAEATAAKQRTRNLVEGTTAVTSEATPVTACDPGL